MKKNIEVYVQETDGTRYSYPSTDSVQALKKSWTLKHTREPDTYLEVAIVSGKTCHVATLQWTVPFLSPAYKPNPNPSWKRMSRAQYLGD